jgi:phosphoribosylformylglycinamidine (FGAM) synthase PurS component
MNTTIKELNDLGVEKTNQIKQFKYQVIELEEEKRKMNTTIKELNDLGVEKTNQIKQFKYQVIELEEEKSKIRASNLN